MNWRNLGVGSLVQGRNGISIYEEDDGTITYTLFVPAEDDSNDGKQLTAFTVVHTPDAVDAYLTRHGIALDGWTRYRPEE